MDNAFLSPRYLKIANEIMEWSNSYLTASNDNIRRPGNNQEVCPFVKDSLENDSFYMAFHPEVNGQRDEPIQRIMSEYINIFKETPPFDPAEKRKKALLVIFPEIPPERTYVLDIVHAKIKHKFVDSGLMIGQFHQNCNERGIYNRGYRVSLSPYPLIAIRHMALHDIIFLRENEDWFKAYNIRYGEKFKDPDKLEDYQKPLLGTYLEAKEKFLK
jgi:heptaprenyl diphosphate synthase